MERLGLYLHIPFCKSKCGYCSFRSSADWSGKAAYLSALSAELALKAPSAEPYGVDSVYLGGGTPSTLEPGEIAGLFSAVRRNYRLLPDAEISLECNPESVTGEKICAWRECGVNRVSMGAQSTVEGILRLLGRIHTSGDAARALDLLTSAFSTVSADFMLGLPGQDFRDLAGMLELVKRFRLRHVSAYGLKVEEGTRFFELCKSGEISLPDGDAAADLYDALRKELSELGLARYEISNFALSGCECRHNLKYWRMEPYLGFGVAAHSYFRGDRFYNTDSLSEYCSFLSAGKSPEAGRERVSYGAAEFEYIMLRLRTAWGIDRNDFAERFHADFAVKYAAILERNAAFFIADAERVRLADSGFYVVNSLLTQFL